VPALPAPSTTHLLSPPSTTATSGTDASSHKKTSSGGSSSGGSITIPPSRAWKLAHANAAAATSGVASTGSAAPTSAPAAPSVRRVPRNKLHGSSRTFEQDYTLLPQYLLGSGASGSVYVCTSRRNPTHEYAVKVIKKDADLDQSKWRSEMQLLAKVRHRNIIRLRDVYESATHIHIVTQLACGGELFERILKTRAFSERDVVNLARHLFHALAYLHSLGIVHRDLKPENILFATADKDADVLITDFGFAANLMARNRAQPLRAKTQLGSRGYMAPEVFSGRAYDVKCDVWSLACVVFICLSGLPPFVDVDAAASSSSTPFWLYTNQMTSATTKPVEFPPSLWGHISDSAKDFLAQCLELDPSKRMRSLDALSHPWLKRRGPAVAHSTMAPTTAAQTSTRNGVAGQALSPASPPVASPASSGSSASASASPSSVSTAGAVDAASSDNLHDAARGQLKNYLTLTINKKDALELARMAAEEGRKAEGNGHANHTDEAASSAADSSALPPPLGGAVRAGHPTAARPPNMIRSLSHDPPNALSSSAPSVSGSPSLSRAESVVDGQHGNGNGSQTLHADSAPGSTVLSRSHSTLPPSSAPSPQVEAAPHAPLPADPVPAISFSSVSAAVSESDGYGSSDSLVLHHHQRDLSTASTSSAASAASSSTMSHSWTRRQRPVHYNTLPQQYLQEGEDGNEEEEEEQQRDERSSDDDATDANTPRPES